MTLPNHALSARSLVELALVVAQVTRCHLDEMPTPSSESLRAFWRSHRTLEQQWQLRLDQWTATGTNDPNVLAEIAPALFASDLLVRVWSTTLAGMERHRRSDDLIRVARHAVRCISRLRNQFLFCLLKIPESQTAQALAIDRLRRRCERWNDVLIGSMAVPCNCYEFSFNESRAYDFGEECSMTQRSSLPSVAEHLLAAGLQLNFLRHLPLETLKESAYEELTQSILCNLPQQATHRDGTLKTSLEQRIAGGRQGKDRLVGDPLDVLLNRIAQSSSVQIFKKHQSDE